MNGPDEELGKMRRANRIPIIELNQHITCTLCKGYFIDATTIIECLHTCKRVKSNRLLELNQFHCSLSQLYREISRNEQVLSGLRCSSAQIETSSEHTTGQDVTGCCL